MSENNKTEKPDFRESIGTMDAESGKRNWIFPKKPKGKFYNKRTWVSYILLFILVLIPTLNYFRVEAGGNPLFQFNVIKRQFYFFGSYFQPQDFPIVAIGGITTVVVIIFFTVVWGRLFCGWVCPQTIFMEMVFRKIEYAIEGDRNKQMKLSRQEWNTEKIQKKGLKWFIFFIISFIIAHIFLSYIVGTHTVLKVMQEGISDNLDTFLGLVGFTFIFFFVFAWFREQACTLVCPYGRFQGVMVDNKTVVVAYDYKRGEGVNGRASFRKNEDRKAEEKGDCIDCNQCVVVCPTGIDIRNGSNQLECVNCTACIDACDEVMEKVGFPTGLIKYASEENIANNTPFKLSTRAIAYSGVMVILLTVFNVFAFTRSKVQTEFLYVPGDKLIETENDYINIYDYRLINKTEDTLEVHLKVVSPQEGSIDFYNVKNEFKLPPRETLEGRIKVVLPKINYTSTKQKVIIGAFDEEDQELDTYKTNFRGPVITPF